MCIILSVDIILATQKGITDRCCAGDAEIPGVANDDDNVLFFFSLFVCVGYSVKANRHSDHAMRLKGEKGGF